MFWRTVPITCPLGLKENHLIAWAFPHDPFQRTRADISRVDREPMSLRTFLRRSDVPTAMAKRPNVLVVVLDCVRADDFWHGGADAESMPFVSRLARESVQYRRAVAPAPWTIPSHASLFTGLYPWEHGASQKGSNTLSPTHPTLARVLRSEGYATLSASANFLVSPFFGLANDFDKAFWGGWWEPFLRFPHRRKREGAGQRRTRPNPIFHRMRSGSFWPIFEASTSKVSQYTALLDLGVRTARKVMRPEDQGYPRSSPWVEAEFSRWLKQQESTTPVFGFVNLIDAHEPYFTDPKVIGSFSDWLRYARQRQDRQGWIRGTWTASVQELSTLHELYRESVRAMDQRLERMVDILKAAGRWEDTLLCITSDHGQAFGEHGILFHMLRVDEEIVRVPLLVRYPGGAGGGKTRRSWVSLVDIAPTVLEAVGASDSLRTSGYPLPREEDVPRPSPVLTVSDGLGPVQGESLSKPLRKKLDTVYAAAYEGSRKVVVTDVPGKGPFAYAVDSEWKARKVSWDPQDPDLERLRGSATEALQLLTKKGSSSLAPGVDERLRAWGYI